MKKSMIVLIGALCAMLLMTPAQAETDSATSREAVAKTHKGLSAARAMLTRMLVRATPGGVADRSVNDTFDLTATGVTLGPYDCGYAHSRTVFPGLPTDGYLTLDDGYNHYYDNFDYTVDYQVTGANGAVEGSDYLWTDGGLYGRVIDYTSDYFFCGTSVMGTKTVTANMDVSFWIDTDFDDVTDLYVDSSTDGGFDTATAYFNVARATPPRAATAAMKVGQPKKAANRSWKVTGKLARTGDATYSGQRLLLQKRQGARWIQVKQCRTGASGTCNVKVRVTRKGTYRFFFSGNAQALPDASPTFTLKKR